MSNEHNNFDSKSGSAPRNDFDQEESSFDIMEWVWRFLRYWYLFVISVAIMLGLAYLKNRKWQPQYYTEAKIMIDANRGGGNYAFMQGFGGGMDYRNSNNQLLVLGSYDLIRRTVEKLPFQIDYFSRGRFKTNNLYGVEPAKIIIEGLSEQAYQHEFRITMLNANEYVIRLEDERGQQQYPEWEVKGVFGEPIENPFFSGTVVKLYSLDNNASFLFRFRDLGSLENEFASRLPLEGMTFTFCTWSLLC